MDCSMEMLERDLNHALKNSAYRKKLFDPATMQTWLEGTTLRMAHLLKPMERAFFICAIAHLLWVHDKRRCPQEMYCGMLQIRCSYLVLQAEREGYYKHRQLFHSHEGGSDVSCN